MQNYGHVLFLGEGEGTDTEVIEFSERDLYVESGF